MKISPEQKRVLLAMRKGNPMEKLVTCVIIKGGCRTNTFFRLLNLQLIRPYGKRNFGQKYVLTKKAVELIKK